MRKIVGLLMILSMLFAVGITKAEAADDAFTITVTISYLEIALKNSAGSVDYTTWDLGSKAVNTVTTMLTGTSGAADEGIYIEVGDSSAYKLTGVLVNTTCDWTAGSSDTTSENTYLLAMRGASDDTVPVMTVTGGATPIVVTTPAEIANATGAAATDIFLYGSFKTPLTTTYGTLQTITVTIAIAAAS